MLKTPFLALLSISSLLPLTVSASPTLTLSNTYALGVELELANGNFNPQGMTYDSSANELLFIQQNTNTIYRTDLSGNLLGSRIIGTIPITNSSSVSIANHTTSIAADAGQYYFTNYTCNSSCLDLYSIGKVSGSAVAISNETAGYGGYPIDVENGLLYRTNASTNYDYSNLHNIRISSTNSPDVVIQTLTLAGAGIADFAVDVDHNSIWVLDYLMSASVRRFDLTTGNLLDTFALGVDGLSSGLAYGNNTLYYYDWIGGNSSLKVFSIGGLSAQAVPEPASLALLGLGLAGLGVGRRRK